MGAVQMIRLDFLKEPFFKNRTRTAEGKKQYFKAHIRENVFGIFL